jgi:acyl carrier protein
MAKPSKEKILDEILPWLNEKIQIKKEGVAPATELITENLIDSMEFLELVSFLEEKFNIELDPDVLTPENFKTPLTVASMVAASLDKHPDLN